MEKDFYNFISSLVNGTYQRPPLAGFDAGDQFNPDRNQDTDVAKNINAAFLILLSGNDHRLYAAANEYLDSLKGDEKWGGVVRFMSNGVSLIQEEIETLCHSDIDFKSTLEKAALFCAQPDTLWGTESLRKIWEVFFPEGAESLLNQEAEIFALRAKRRVRVTAPNASPIDNPSRQMLFLSNLLVTTPQALNSLDNFPILVAQKLKETMAEKQRYWFDHPIQMGVPNANNEAIYGLRGLDK
ncbi:MAG TPA: hypothetical protein VKA69_06290, partial [Desulfobacteria bacterium]|nr:hypothetical protein [Desulfobacteria bacterium]